jgi:hypothetical protein
MTTLATKRALIGQHLTTVEKHHAEAVKLISTIDDANARQAIQAIQMASYHCEKARIEAGKL